MTDNTPCFGFCYDYLAPAQMAVLHKSSPVDRPWTKEEVRQDRIEGAKELFVGVLLGLLMLTLYLLQAACFGVGLWLLIDLYSR